MDNIRALQKKRTTNFREDETKLLIQLWGSRQIQNKLYLTHRKEPVMRLLATNMQLRGFYRTPDEIKTRIRNLKCLYHRIKRTVQSGAGVGTVDPDWPHYKAMDAILSKQNQKKENLYKDSVFDGPECIEIKQEIEDIDINDDMESFTTNSMAGSEFEDEQFAMPPLTPAPKEEPQKIFPKILPSLTLPAQNQAKQQQAPISTALPFPLLILNGLQTQQGVQQDKNDMKSPQNPGHIANDVGHVLKELLEVQKENLDIERQRLELERQRLEFERFVGSQLLTLGPVITTLFQKFVFPEAEEGETNAKRDRKRAHSSDIDSILKDSKILRNLLSEGIKKYVMEADDGSENEMEDSGIQNGGDK